VISDGFADLAVADNHAAFNSLNEHRRWYGTCGPFSDGSLGGAHEALNPGACDCGGNSGDGGAGFNRPTRRQFGQAYDCKTDRQTRTILLSAEGTSAQSRA